ncbi:MAG: alcohol dehydrogenase catalytic domain-containing protein [Planctomycetaceae bacterium]|nr:alcohol dehydrogenase catalytic domain-containing protein [Planctomycetaceae bacterium]
MAKQRLMAAVTGDGRIITITQDIPALKDGSVLVEIRASLVSPGTELNGWRSLAAAREKPNPQAQPKTFGYSCAGVVAEVSSGAEEFKVGDRVACVGGGYAPHATHGVVPHNLCVALPENVTFQQGAYAMLAATALHALRRGEPVFGEYVAVAGLGLLGQLAGQLHHLAGNYVIGWDTIAFRTDLARRTGFDAAATVGKDDEVAATKAFTAGRGLDAAVLAFGGDGNAVMRSLQQTLKVTPDGHTMGKIVVVGNPSFDWPFRASSNAEVRQAGRTGPGYHDELWEYGAAYPGVYMRWNTRTNLELCMRLISQGRLNVDALTTHTIPLADVQQGIAAIIGEPDRILGVVFTM